MATDADAAAAATDTGVGEATGDGGGADATEAGGDPDKDERVGNLTRGKVPRTARGENTAFLVMLYASTCCFHTWTAVSEYIGNTERAPVDDDAEVDIAVTRASMERYATKIKVQILRQKFVYIRKFATKCDSISRR